jgi:hypothetical protein
MALREHEMEEQHLKYVVRDQDDGIPPLDLLQAWGPPLRPRIRIRLARLLMRLANRLDASTHRTPPCYLTCNPGHPADTCR